MIRFSSTPSVDKPHDIEVHEAPDFVAFATELESMHVVAADKTSCDMIVQAAEWSTPYRSKSNIKSMARFFVCDIDGKTPEQMEAIFDRLAQVSCVLYTTHSHMAERKGGLECWRIIVELSDEYAVAEYYAIWRAVDARLGVGTLDSATAKQPAQAYYCPASRPDAPYVFLHNPGEPWITADLVAEAPVVETRGARGGEAAPPRPAVRKAVAAWYKHTEKEPALAAKCILEDKPGAPIGEGKRNTLLISIAGWLAHRWPEADPGALASRFDGAGWGMFAPDGKYTTNDLAEMIGRCQENEQATLAVAEQERIKDASAGKRTETVTWDEITNLRDLYGESWTRHLIGLYARDCYLLQADGTYRVQPVLKDNLHVAMRDDFAVFGDYFTDKYTDENGLHQKTIPQILQEYSTCVSDVIYDWIGSKPWDPESRTIYLAPQVPDIAPKEHPEIQGWLDRLDPILTDAISQVPHHDQMLPALVLTGRKASGKTLIAHGLSTIYSDHGPVDAKVAFGKFNANALKRCPIVVIDEKPPQEFFNEGTSLLRRWITEPTRQLDGKYQNVITLRGYLRIVVTANSQRVLTTKEDMSSEDRNAFAERLIHVQMDDGGEYLDKIGKDRIQERWLGRRWFAEHVLWLGATHAVQHPGNRMAVEQPPNRFHASLSSQSGTTGEVLYWLVRYLEQPSKAEQAKALIRRSDGELKVHASAIIDHWDMYLPAQKPPTANQISSAVRSLSTGKRAKLGAGRRRVNGYVLDLEQIEQAIVTHGADVILKELLK